MIYLKTYPTFHVDKTNLVKKIYTHKSHNLTNLFYIIQTFIQDNGGITFFNILKQALKEGLKGF